MNNERGQTLIEWGLVIFFIATLVFVLEEHFYKRFWSTLKHSIRKGTEEFLRSANVSRWGIVIGIMISYLILIINFFLIQPLCGGGG